MTALQATDIDLALEYFDQTRRRVLEVTTGLSGAQWRFKPAPDRWSIAEILEHMVIVQERVLGPIREQLAQAPAPPPDRDNSLLGRIVLEKIPDRSIRVQGPEILNPAGRWSPPEALDRLARNYRRLAEFVKSTPDLRGHILESAPLRIVTDGAFTTMDGYQWALTAAAHDQRHVGQMLEVQADPRYPPSA
jgi:DinB superfamily